MYEGVIVLSRVVDALVRGDNAQAAIEIELITGQTSSLTPCAVPAGRRSMAGRKRRLDAESV